MFQPFNNSGSRVVRKCFGGSYRASLAMRLIAFHCTPIEGKIFFKSLYSIEVVFDYISMLDGVCYAQYSGTSL